MSCLALVCPSHFTHLHHTTPCCAAAARLEEMVTAENILVRKILNHVPKFLTPDLLEDGCLVSLLEELGYFSADDKRTVEELGGNPKQRSQFVSSVVQSKGESPFRQMVKVLRDGHAHNPTYQALLTVLYSVLDRGVCGVPGVGGVAS